MSVSPVKAFVPNKLEILTLLIISLGFLLLVNLRNFSRNIIGEQYYTDFTQSLSDSIRQKISIFDSQKYGTLAVFSFWLGIGFIVYVVVSVVGHSSSYFIQDYDDSHNLKFPNDSAKKKQLKLFNLISFIRTISLLGFIGWLYIFLRYLLPYSTKSFIVGLQHTGDLWFSLLAVITLSASIFIFFILARCFVLRIRVFEKSYR